MKIRWTSDSVRLRITPSELEKLQAGQWIREELRLGIGRLAAELVPGCHAEGIEVEDDGTLRFYLRDEDVVRLAEPAREGLYFRTSDRYRPVRYFVEKDFPCEHPREGEAGESQGDTFTRLSAPTAGRAQTPSG